MQPRLALPPASWVERAATALAGRGVDIVAIADAQDACASWFAAGLEPERVAIDEVDISLARWLASLTAITRTTYQMNLRSLAVALGMSSPRPVRALVDAAISKPKALDARLKRFAANTSWKMGTLKARCSSLHRASCALVHDGLAKRKVASERPRDTDVQVRAASAHEVDALDALLKATGGPIAARNRAVLRLCWGAALAPKELHKLDHASVHLARRRLVLGAEVIPLDKETAEAVRAWLVHRGRTDGPLLIAFEGKNLLPTNRRVTPRELQRSFANAARVAEVQLTLSSLRGGALLHVVESRGREVAQVKSRNASRDGVNRLLREVPRKRIA